MLPVRTERQTVTSMLTDCGAGVTTGSSAGTEPGNAASARLPPPWPSAYATVTRRE